MRHVDLPRHDRTGAGQVSDTQPGDGGLAQLREALRDALLHLYTPHLHPPSLLYQVLGCDPRAGPGPLQARLLASIGDLEPDAGTPPGCRARRAYEALHLRFVQGLTQEETAERLCISVRHLQRVQQEATDTLAYHLWERWLAWQASGSAATPIPAAPARGGTQAPDWRQQADLELASLQASAPRGVADVGEAIRGALDLERIVAAKRGIRLAAKHLQPGLSAAIHPMALRQMLITALGRLVQRAAAGEIAVYAALEGGMVKVTLVAPLETDSMLAEADVLGEIIAPPGASVELRQQRQRLYLWIRVPAVEERTVLVVEDNPDMVLFYRHCTSGTPYRIVHVAPDEDIVAQIEALAPDVVLLDVMMPHVDGWQVLTHLHERPSTRAIPVIVCSVVKEEELALALGAVHFISKPVQPRELVAALDRALHLASRAASPPPAPSAAA
jgi:CheY-like chemotaxis protein